MAGLGPEGLFPRQFSHMAVRCGQDVQLGKWGGAWLSPHQGPSGGGCLGFLTAWIWFQETLEVEPVSVLKPRPLN